jgi:hypothetical protein
MTSNDSKIFETKEYKSRLSLFSSTITKKHSEDENALTRVVEKFAKDNPEKYKRAQKIGEEIINENLPNKKEFVDDKEEKERLGRLVTLIKYNGLDENSLRDDEKELLKKHKMNVSDFS